MKVVGDVVPERLADGVQGGQYAVRCLRMSVGLRGSRLTRHDLGLIRGDPGQSCRAGEFRHRLPQDTTQLHLNINNHVPTPAPTNLHSVPSERKASDGTMTSAQMLQEALGKMRQVILLHRADVPGWSPPGRGSHGGFPDFAQAALPPQSRHSRSRHPSADADR